VSGPSGCRVTQARLSEMCIGTSVLCLEYVSNEFSSISTDHGEMRRRELIVRTACTGTLNEDSEAVSRAVYYYYPCTWQLEAA